jgi:hypothetical protein
MTYCSRYYVSNPVFTKTSFKLSQLIFVICMHIKITTLKDSIVTKFFPVCGLFFGIGKSHYQSPLDNLLRPK